MVYKGGKSNYKRKTKGKRKTGRYAKSRDPFPLRNNVNVGLGFPKRMAVKQKYADTFTLTSTAGAINNHSFVLNGLYDPDYTGGGHQPMYFDQYMAVYNHFTCIGAKMTVKFIGYESNTVPMVIALWQNDDTTITPTTIDYFAEQSKGKQGILTDQAGKPSVLTLKWSPKKTFGSVLANTLLRGNSGANPQETSIGTISIQSADQSSTGSVSVQVMIEYITIYSELRDLQGS